MGSFTDEFKKWASQPFSEDMPASHWFLFIGFIVILIIAWNIILYHLFEAIRGTA
jgi:hypothetical protein